MNVAKKAWAVGIMGALLLAKVHQFSLARQADVRFRWGPVIGGAFFSLASPGFILWWATIGAPVVLQGALLTLQLGRPVSALVQSLPREDSVRVLGH